MATVSETRSHGLRRPGASLLGVNVKSKGLPSRPNESILPKKTVNIATDDDNPATASTSPTSNDPRSPGIEQKSLLTKPLPSPELKTVTQPAPVSSLSSRSDEENRQPNITSLPRSPNRLPTSPQPSDNVPLEQFIPEPEASQTSPGLKGQEGSTVLPVDESKPVGHNNAPYIPPLPEPLIIAPLTKVHFSCYQSHRIMPVSNNVWYATACMTCHKIDQEVRHRCTFCCLRICVNCFQSLQERKDRSLAELMSTGHS